MYTSNFICIIMYNPYSIQKTQHESLAIPPELVTNHPHFNRRDLPGHHDKP
jgi:hypothetical protein